jgi:hypothetical protein
MDFATEEIYKARIVSIPPTGQGGAEIFCVGLLVADKHMPFWTSLLMQIFLSSASAQLNSGAKSLMRL